ncbi:unnamed protein product [Pocillopora meandrina]|uniref:Uncharacterized protein n=1 Tax=Pocillopora meandrina TaxID=46732 RepID=A0AAU9Y507_9CNID|nr:unnamed protein product [Pocillopora meandrina]
MAERTSRKRNFPARLREGKKFLMFCWYLVTCEDDCALRVLHEDEVQHIFPEDNEEELQVSDVVSALWLPNDQYYDAKVLQKGGDKEELMKERICLEKAKKNEFSNQKKVQKRSRNIQMIATQSYSNVRTKERKQKRRRKKKKNKDRLCYCRQENHKLLHDGHLSVLLQVTTTKWKKRRPFLVR